MLSILFVVTDCSVLLLYSLPLSAQNYIHCHWLLITIFIVTDCSVLSTMFIVTDCSVLSTMFIVTLAQYYIPCHWLPYFETNLYSLSPTFSVFYSLLCCELNLYSLTLIDMRLFLDTTALYYWTKLFRPGAELLLRTWLSKFFRSSARLIVNVIVHNSFLCKGRKETTKWI